MTLRQQTEKGVIVAGGVIDPGHQRETRLLLHSGGKEDYVCSARDHLEQLLVLPLTEIKVRGNDKTLIQAGWQRAQTIQG